MSPSKDDWLKQLRDEIPEVSPEDLRRELGNGNGVVVVDVRESDEYRAGHVPGAIHLPRGFLELQAEKKLPVWLRYGGAVYAERYYYDATVHADGDPWWTRKWSLENLAKRGGMRELTQVLAFPIDPDDREDGLRLLLEAGLVVAFMVDGGCPPVQEAHEALKRALAAGRLHARDVEALEGALREHEAMLRSFIDG